MFALSGSCRFHLLITISTVIKKLISKQLSPFFFLQMYYRQTRIISLFIFNSIATVWDIFHKLELGDKNEELINKLVLYRGMEITLLGTFLHILISFISFTFSYRMMLTLC